jgi:hypothetical protein
MEVGTVWEGDDHLTDGGRNNFTRNVARPFQNVRWRPVALTVELGITERRIGIATSNPSTAPSQIPSFFEVAMARKSNDDRSDSLNPNNPAYKASQRNHCQQVRDDDDDYPAPVFSYVPEPRIVEPRPLSTEPDIVFPVAQSVKPDPSEAAALNKAFSLEPRPGSGFCLSGSSWYKVGKSFQY